MPRTRGPRHIELAVAMVLVAACQSQPPVTQTAGPAASAGPTIIVTQGPTPAPTTIPVPTGRIAFIRDAEVFIVDADGSNVRRLTDDRRLDLHLYWLADGSRLVTVWEQRDDPYRQYLTSMLPDGSDKRDLGLVQQYSDPMTSPDGRYVAFGGDGDNGIVLLDLLTGERIELALEGATEALWSPDSNMVVAILPSRGLMVYEVPGGRRVLDLPGEVVDLFGWTPDGAAVLYRTCDSNLDVYGCADAPITIGRLDGSPPSQYDGEVPTVPDGVVSSDGRWVTIEGSPWPRIGRAQAAWMVTWVTASHSRRGYSWSPDSIWLAAPHGLPGPEGGLQIVLRSPYTKLASDFITLTSGPEDRAPAWQPR